VRLGAHIVFVDETGFQLTPVVRRTWAQRGQTPILYHDFRRGHLSVISGLTVSPRRQRLGLVYRAHERSIDGELARAFLRELLRHLRGPVIVVWDNLGTHKGAALRELCSRQPRLHLEYLPPYAPDLNPDEGIWNHAKRDLANGAVCNLNELWVEVVLALERTRQSTRRLRGCFKEAGLPLMLS
jgi:transposase